MGILSKQLTVTAPAKLNLHLAIFDKRSDGLHNLESIILALDFGDILHFEPAEGENRQEIVMEGTAGFGLPVEKNIIFKALSLFRSKTGFTHGLRIRVEKRIPIGGGLGGGSSDAASTLLVLNKLAGFPLNRDEILEIALGLGSDIPFFIYETGAAFVSGRGENIKPLELPYISFVLVNPGFSSDTAAAFKLLDEYRKRRKIVRGNRHLFAGRQKCLFYNDFLPVFKEPEKSVYSGIISQLYELGAGFVSLSGTGSTCFGVFKEKPQAEKAAESLRGAGRWSFVECACSVFMPRPIYNLNPSLP
ncbi:MAG: 4-(cytidine 5'-diphospho)-2-C-methyl-D-erythritol kinase [Treponema sp.]|jgi:4-diphosphocytidyl-2-C-methyl-D-erythritol kinase|nr:4-(cytidine 5'-diphospho)-2-C-methyl-D-erythritol kinase [Treponema sp.]